MVGGVLDSITNLRHEVTRTALTIEHAQHLSDLLRLLRPALLDDHAKDNFRSLGGFEVLLLVLRRAPNAYISDGLDRPALLDLLNALFELLSEALSENIVNQRVFGKEAIEFGNALIATSILSDPDGQERAFGLLFSLSFLEDDAKVLFRRLRQQFEGRTLEGIQRILSSSEVLRCPQVVPVIINFWCHQNASSNNNPELMAAVILALAHISTMSKYNLVAMHSTNITIKLLEQLSTSSNMPAIESALQDLCSQLLSLGMNDAADAAILLQLASHSEVVASLLAQLTRTTDKAPEFHFDHSFDGYAAIEFGGLPTAFPPQQTGYTLCTWLNFDTFDDNSHTTILGALDTSQSCFLLVYIEQVTRQLVLQTSVTSKKPSVKFKSITFDEKTSYHVALAHHRASQQVYLYVNGQLQEQLDCLYPRQSSSDQGVQAFIGTPYDFAARLGRNMLCTKWSLSTLHLFSEFLSPESILVYHKLGPAYRGSYRDDLGTFLTYSASADLTLKDERLSRDKHSKQGLGNVIRRKQLRDDLLLALNTSLYLNHSTDQDHLLVRTKAARAALGNQSQHNEHGFVVNAALTNLGDAFVDTSMLGQLTIGVIVCRADTIADQYWQLAGAVPIMINCVATATSLANTVESIRTIFNLLKHSWRLSNAFETANAFAILAWILRIKVGATVLDTDPTAINIVLLAEISRPAMSSLFSLILESVGIDVQSPKSSLVTNPLAYRYLVLDTMLWTCRYPECQRVFYEHLIFVLEDSRYRNTNVKHLTRMRVLHKLIDSFKHEPLHPEAAITCTRAITVLLSRTSNADAIRSLSLYITSALQEKPNSADHVRSQEADAMPEAHLLTGQSLGKLMLDSFSAFVCDGETSAVTRFTKTVTNKWLLHLLDSEDVDVMCKALRMLARVLVTEAPAYVSKFEEKTRGFVLMRATLTRWWRTPFVWAAAFGILFGIDISAIKPFMFQLDSFYRAVTKRQIEIHHAGAWTVIAGLLDQAASHNPRDSEESDVLSTSLAFLQTLVARSENFMHFAGASTLSRDVFCLLFRQITDSKAQTTAEAPDTSKRQQSLMTLLPLTDEQMPSRDNTNDLNLDKPLAATDTILDDYLHQDHCDQVLQIMAAIYTDQIFHRKDFATGLYFRAPKASLTVRTHRSVAVIKTLLSFLAGKLSSEAIVFHQAQCLTNIARFASQTLEAILEGWLADTTFDLLHFLASLLAYLHSPGVRETKVIRLCSPTIEIMVDVFRRLVLTQLCQLQLIEGSKSRVNFVTWLVSWKRILLARGTTDDIDLEQLFYIICRQIMLADTPDKELQKILTKLWCSCIRVEPSRSLQALTRRANNQHFGHELFAKLNNEPLPALDFIVEHWRSIEHVTLELLRGPFERWRRAQNQFSHATAEARSKKREDRLHQRHLDDLERQHAVTEHNSRKEPWNMNIAHSELAKRQRARQDQQDNDIFLQAQYTKGQELVHELTLFDEIDKPYTWEVDNAEGRERQKLRLRPLKSSKTEKYLSKRARSTSMSSNVQHKRLPSRSVQQQTDRGDTSEVSPIPEQSKAIPQDDGTISLDEFELIDDPREEIEDAIDIHRKVMRSLQRGEQILEVHNVSRVRGLEAVSSLLIVGQKCLYLLDNLFQCLNGEVVNAEQAPRDEIDQYVLNILGNPSVDSSVKPAVNFGDMQHWAWADILNISKRRFLLRDVALELFFLDGRSYLITTSTVTNRETLFTNLQARVPSTSDISPLYKWRTEQFVVPDIKGRSRVFSFGSENPVTARWLRGEISNFQYLMLVNTMAGRTFTDLTQYPVFPWVLQDYKSETLDLDDPTVYRDLSKPMGAQDRDREAAYRDRYRAFMEMGDPTTPAFHYGTHYSSAMIVTSYLIRLEPFVRSYVLLQGGAFDHPERLFDSIAKAWLSASRDTVTDVRELTPEFFYLPDFLTNINGFEFGTKQGTGEKVDHVKLPPWAHGDPKIFIAKQREALESPYVTEHLHAWIDLIFGYKQQGEAAIEATNVFHHLSYHGAKNLDEIEDERERLAAIGIIHNFGQTPRQIFFRPHSKRIAASKTRTVHEMLISIAQSPEPLVKAQTPVYELELSSRSAKPVHAGPFRTYRTPTCQTYVEWGNTDGSLRIYKADSGRLLDLFEALHTDHITCAAFIDAETFVTTSIDCTVSVWSLTGPIYGPFDLNFKAGLFGHRSAVNTLLVSSTLSTIVTASVDGQVIVWDVNSLERLRVIDHGDRVDSATIDHRSGKIILCSGIVAKVYSINGELILEQSLCAALGDRITSCAFYQSTGSEWIGGDFVLTGHTEGVAKIWKIASTRGVWHLELLSRLSYADGTGTSVSREADITCVYAINRRVFTGDEDGNVYEWIAK